MDLEIIILRSKSDRQIPYDIIYMWSVKYGTDELIYETETGLPGGTNAEDVRDKDSILGWEDP